VVVKDVVGAIDIENAVAPTAGIPPAGAWCRHLKVGGRAAAQAPAQRSAYTLGGLPPFLRLKRQAHLNVEPLVVGDSLFQRIMVSMIVNPEKVYGVNADAAKAFESYLLAPATQAWVRAFRYPDFDQQAWWPAGRHNNARE